MQRKTHTHIQTYAHTIISTNNHTCAYIYTRAQAYVLVHKSPRTDKNTYVCGASDAIVSALNKELELELTY